MMIFKIFEGEESEKLVENEKYTRRCNVNTLNASKEGSRDL